MALLRKQDLLCAIDCVKRSFVGWKRRTRQDGGHSNAGKRKRRRRTQYRNDRTHETKEKENACSTEYGYKREPIYTEKGLEDMLQRKIALRKAKHSQLTTKMKKISSMMKNYDDPDNIDGHLNEFSKLMSDFVQENKSAGRRESR